MTEGNFGPSNPFMQLGVASLFNVNTNVTTAVTIPSDALLIASNSGYILGNKFGVKQKVK